MAFITSKNSPRVKIVAGKVKSTSIGFTNIFRSPSTTATNSAVTQLVTFTPGSKFASMSTKTVVKKIFISVFI